MSAERHTQKKASQRLYFVVGMMSAIGLFFWFRSLRTTDSVLSTDLKTVAVSPEISSPRVFVDSSGFSATLSMLPEWSGETSLDELSLLWKQAGYRKIEQIDAQLREQVLPPAEVSNLLIMKAMLLNYEGDAHAAYEVLDEAQALFQQQPQLASQYMGTLTYLQGVTALRCGESDN